MPSYKSLRLDELLFIEKYSPKSAREIIESEARNHSALSGDLVGAYNSLLKAMRGESIAGEPELAESVGRLASKLKNSNQIILDVYATAMLRYRGGQGDLKLRNVQLCEGIHPRLVEAIADFGREESRGGREPELDTYSPVSSEQEIVSATQPPSKTDWGRIMLALGRYFPQWSCFYSETEFLQKPISWIYWMLEVGVETRRQELHELELPTAYLRKTLIQANSRNPNQVKVEDLFLFKGSGKGVDIPAEVCNAFFALAREELLPEWAHTYELVEQMRRRQNGDAVPHPRALIGEGIYILRYEIKEGKIHAKFAGVEKAADVDDVKDPDTGKTYRISLGGHEDGFYLDEPFPFEELA